jgi:catechol 2,3-dioxygenase-like lactoylglutathione lyase family enzyme
LKRISEIGAFDHVALPIENVEQMISFYSALGLLVREDEKKVTVHFGDQKINVHRTSLWQSEAFTLRAAAA